MKRKLYDDLVAWKSHARRKPLILYGVRQVGKTYLLKEFGACEFTRCHYLNFEEESDLCGLFEQNLKPSRLLQEIEFRLNTEIDIERDLVLFDEIQACPLALTSLKYFCEDLPELAIIGAGSLLGLHLNGTSFPVGKVDMMTLYPMSFEEFLTAVDDRRGLSAFRSASLEETPSAQVHEYLWRSLKRYFVVGGMPEVVKVFRDSEKNGYAAMEAVRAQQTTLIAAYLADMAKHAGKVNAMHIERVWRATAQQLGQSQNGSASKFKFKGVVPGVSHYSRLVGAIDWLSAAGLVHKVHIASAGHLPLLAYTKENSFKLFLCDVGLLGSMAGLSPKSILDYDYGTYKGFFAENFVAQELLAMGTKRLISWQEKQAEVEFLIDVEGELVPVEVKSGHVTRAKSLGIFREKYDPKLSVVLSARPLRVDRSGKILRCPLYLVGRWLNFRKDFLIPS